MKAVIVGSGNVAEAFAKAIADKGAEHGVALAGLAARNRARGPALAERCSTHFVSLSDPTGLPEADIYVLAVSDRAVSELSENLRFPAGATVAHTGGCIPLSELSDYIRHRAVIYPLQTFSAGRHADFGDIPVFIEASDRKAADTAGRLARALSAHVEETDSDTRALLHLSGAIACNLVNALYAVASRVAGRAGFEFGILAPLVTETARKAVESGNPASVQTGAAVRGDARTVKRHMELLEKLMEHRFGETYAELSGEIRKTAEKHRTNP